MQPVEIRKDIYWVGAIDWNLRNFHGYLTQRGSTYNAYLIVDEKVTLIDTVKWYLADEMLERIASVIDPSKIDYIVTNHVEMDHSGSLPRIMEIAKNAVIVTSPNGLKGLNAHYRSNWKLREVKSGDSLPLGRRSLTFQLMPMVHWPDSMATYCPEERILFPNDAFGQHIASSERFDDQLPIDILREEARKYYANIVMPYGQQVSKALDALSGFPVDVIAPSHGVIWRQHIPDIVKCYELWASNTTEKKAVIIYDSMWRSTELIARELAGAFNDKSIAYSLFDLKETHVSDIMTSIQTARYICVGSPTLNNNMMPTVAAFLTYLKGLAPKNRFGLAFGSYGWGGQSVGQISEVLQSLGFAMLEPIKVNYIPIPEQLREIRETVKQTL